LVIFYSHQDSNLFGIGESLGFDRGVRQEYADEETGHDSQSSNGNVEYPLAREISVGKANSVRDETAEDLRQRVTYIEP
jgi:hypothetical protein